MEKHGITIHALLKAKRLGDYTVFIFEDVATSELICVTKLPNWQDYKEIEIGDDGFLTYVFINATVDKWRDHSGNTINYRYSGNYFQTFIHNEHTIKNGEVIRKELLIK